MGKDIKIGFIGHSCMFEEFVQHKLEGIDLIWVTEEDLDYPLDLDYMIVRNTTSIKEKMEKFVKDNPSINFLDNVERFNSPLGKKESSFSRAKEGTGAMTFLDVTEETKFPIVAKPILGRKEQGIYYLDSYSEFLQILASINLKDYIFQEKLDIYTEYRALVLNINGVLKCYVRQKVRAAGTVQKKMKVSKYNVNKITDFIKETRDWKTGIIGYDVAILNNGEIKYIEENRSPMFNITQKRLEVSFPKEIMQIISDTHDKC